MSESLKVRMSQSKDNCTKAQKIHILGIAGTFMGGIAQIAQAMSFDVSGSDKAIYPPMSTQLAQAGITVSDEQSLEFLNACPNSVVIGNALSRGHIAVEATLNAQQLYTSGPQWLAENVLKDCWVIAVAGTHGKTTTASMVAWILEYVGLNPGFLIGGVPANFGVSARLGAKPFFVVEADEYDTAFFDKRSKFVHYRPRTLVINNLEFDHADIFENLAAIQTQFHHCVRTVPGNGLIVLPVDDPNVDAVIAKGCWTALQTQSLAHKEEGGKADWHANVVRADGSEFEVFYRGQLVGTVAWPMTGLHNVRNAISALAAAQHAGVPIKEGLVALSLFKGVARRMSWVGEVNGITVFDDFAHHPTAIATTLEGAKQRLMQNNQINKLTRPGRLIAVFEPRSNTMRMGIHAKTLPASFACADAVYAFIDPVWQWNLPTKQFSQPVRVLNAYEDLLQCLLNDLEPGDTVVVMSNGSFGEIHQKLVAGLKNKYKLSAVAES
ncbi:UDP-N-acetylmuramate:L-alanyl-gamma-D-glutamyl-meso-diaminopimelate ligase [Thiomicrorhabdus aquaedulcis]|uniref:UDP-N-acetylmuramate:L-alanyl-gamma-D-glutamyl- meso-diaminopimelate ligase n=1 Tax=Thiomicrorhabdus aquaedulcis TaxID=2211106 RepID=UPI001E38C9D1|nr:UDP-N-acetylmuramate:L-alanyl-gamma-D-glutamyl-meso-diaminopimelate ligase [Thiomicrorhabdus aquaedulcis]